MDFEAKDPKASLNRAAAAAVDQERIEGGGLPDKQAYELMKLQKSTPLSTVQDNLHHEFGHFGI